MTSDSWSFDTLQIHAGATPAPGNHARAVPIYASTSFVYDDAEQAAGSFLLDDLNTYVYTRLSNPTSVAAEERLAALENGAFAVAVASGQAATSLTLLNLLRTGDHVVASSHVYGGTALLLRHASASSVSTLLLFRTSITRMPGAKPPARTPRHISLNRSVIRLARSSISS